jgi:ATP-dependent DNA ligase
VWTRSGDSLEASALSQSSCCATKLDIWTESAGWQAALPAWLVPSDERENRILNVPTTTKARFIEPMLLLRTERLPEGPEWQTELKLDGYRALAFKTGGKVHRRSRNDNDFNGRYPGPVKALAPAPEVSASR